MFQPHYPPHLYIDNEIYFVTARTVDTNHYFDTENKKQLLLDIIKKSCQRCGAELIAWVVLDNHYHILFRLREGERLAKLMQYINGSSAFQLNRMENKRKRKIWFNYWDTCIRDEDGFYTRLNYIHHNPRKHGYVEEIQDLASYPFSSHKDFVDRYGVEWMEDCFSKYPIIGA